MNIYRSLDLAVPQLLFTMLQFVLRMRLAASEASLLQVISVIAGAGRVGKETIVKRGKLLLDKRVL